MFHWLRSLFRLSPNPHATFVTDQTSLLDAWFRTAAAGEKPKWLTWLGYEPIDDPHFTHNVALVPLLVRFEPMAGGPLEDVPQAREPRAVVAVFRFTRGRWTTDGRAVFNLTVQQVAEQLEKMGEIRSHEPPR